MKIIKGGFYALMSFSPLCFAGEPGSVVLDLGTIPDNLDSCFMFGVLSPVVFFVFGMCIGLVYKAVRSV
ncbi:hypothetical protein [Escherichia coli]|uniref:hypothetical protein n=1 Tax=Escherichia coli TaxID=562 RepID=UPI00031A3502|nr:hypothetical protein [Escherichia coli]